MGQAATASPIVRGETTPPKRTIGVFWEFGVLWYHETESGSFRRLQRQSLCPFAASASVNCPGWQSCAAEPPCRADTRL